MADKLKHAQPSRLASVTKSDKTAAETAYKGATASKKKLKPSGVRLSDESRADLQALVKAVDGISNSRVTGSDIIRALIHHGANKMKPEQVLRALRDSLY